MVALNRSAIKTVTHFFKDEGYFLILHDDENYPMKRENIDAKERRKNLMKHNF